MDTKTSNKTVVMLDPSRVLADHNYRHSLIKTKVQAMAEAIVSDGGILNPIEVEALAGNPDYDYLIATGHYRYAGLVAANKDGAGLELPAFVVGPFTPLERINRQLSENMERENNSPIDEARAMKALLDEGATRMDVRTRFKRRGSNKPASNSFVNMTISFLELPKKIQNKIHEGTVGVGAAYELVKAYKVAVMKGMDPIETVTKIVEQAEAATAKRLEMEDQEEERFLEAERKADEARTQHEAAVKVLEAKQEEVEAAAKAAEAARSHATRLYGAKAKAKGDAKKAAEEQFRAAEKLASDAERAAAIRQKELEKAQTTVEKVAAVVTTQSQRVVDARSAAPKAGSKGVSALGAAAVKKSAAAAGATEGVTPLNGTQLKALISTLALPSSYPMVQEIGKTIKACMDGTTTEAQMIKALATLTGEYTAPAPKAKKNKAA